MRRRDWRVAHRTERRSDCERLLARPTTATVAAPKKRVRSRVCVVSRSSVRSRSSPHPPSPTKRHVLSHRHMRIKCVGLEGADLPLPEGPTRTTNSPLAHRTRHKPASFRLLRQHGDRCDRQCTERDFECSLGDSSPKRAAAEKANATAIRSPFHPYWFTVAPKENAMT
jgi:hypothetical protein